MRIAFFGSSLVSAYWNGAATYYRGVVRGLSRSGHRITFYEPDAFERQAHRDMPDPEWATVVVYSAGGTDDVLLALEEAKSYDLVIKASGVGVFDELLEAAVADLSAPSRRTIFWDVDAPATLARVASTPADPFRANIPRYDLILTYGGGPPVVRAYEALGAKRCVPIYNALDPDTHHGVHPEPRFSGELGFLGNRLPDREQRVDAFFFEAAACLPERRFVLGGNGWADKRRPSNVEYVGHVFTRDHNAFNSSLGAVLNVNRNSMADVGWSPPTRVFEAAGAGACLISDAWVGIEDFLEPEREVLIAHDGRDVAEHLRSHTPEQRRAIGEAARRRVLAHHTYDHRVEQLLEVLA
jgi:spore maturation protein CgeB